MPELDRRKIADTLQRNGSYLADVAAKSLGKLPPDLFGASSATLVSDVPSHADLGGEVTVPQSQDEIVEMVVDGFRRLGSVVALSVLVDEPGLIADDLVWLQEMFGTRGFPMMDKTFLLQLTRTYVDACRLVLADEEVALVEKLVSQSFYMLDSRDTSTS